MDDVKDESAEGEMKSELDDLMDCLMNKEKITHPIATVAVCRASQTCRLPSSRDSITSIACHACIAKRPIVSPSWNRGPQDKWKLLPAFLQVRGLVKQHIDRPPAAPRSPLLPPLLPARPKDAQRRFYALS